MRWTGGTVTAGTVNCDGALSVRAERAGSDTAMADIVRAVEAAQARAAPVQRLADQVLLSAAALTHSAAARDESHRLDETQSLV